MLSIHNNLSAGAQNVTGAYIIVTSRFNTWQSTFNYSGAYLATYEARGELLLKKSKVMLY